MGEKTNKAGTVGGLSAFQEPAMLAGRDPHAFDQFLAASQDTLWACPVPKLIQGR